MSVLAEFLEALTSGDIDRVLPLVAAEAAIIGVREQADPRLPIYGTHRGPEGMRAFLGALHAAFETELFEIDRVMQEGDAGFACGRFRHRVRHTGSLFPSHWALQAEFADGKLVLYRFYEDTAALEAAFGVSTAGEIAA